MSFYKFAKTLMLVIFRIIYRIEVNGINNIPAEGRAIICSNHISNLDPIILGIISPRDISFMAKKELFRNKLFSILFSSLNAFPVDREGSDLSAIRKSLNVLENEQILGIFPEGTRVSEMNLNSAKPGISLIGIKAKSPIIPVFIDTNYKLFSKIKVNIGEPLNLNDYYGKRLKTEDHRNISKYILESIYSLKNK